ncbi:MAG: hypothetical protein LQ341_000644 [Variospora aurantia]|nr:MAG: hypothetical protein LQ341_000644 [Variospora aurantia]
MTTEPGEPATMEHAVPLPLLLMCVKAPVGDHTVKKISQMDLSLPYPRLDAATVGVLKPQPHMRACQLPAETGSGRRGSMQGVRAAEEDANHHRQKKEPAPKASQGRSRTRFHPDPPDVEPRCEDHVAPDSFRTWNPFLPRTAPVLVDRLRV